MPAIDLETWPRRAIHDFFRTFEDPWFNLTAEVDVTQARAWCASQGVPFSLATWYAVLRAAMSVPELSLRLRPDHGVWAHTSLRIGITVLRADKTFCYAYLPEASSLLDFIRRSQACIEARLESAELAPAVGEDDLLYGTTIPWVRFTAIKHARSGDPLDSVPRIALGRATATPQGQKMPVSVEAHHALVDGLHVGAFFDALQRQLDTLPDHVMR